MNHKLKSKLSQLLESDREFAVTTHGAEERKSQCGITIGRSKFTTFLIMKFWEKPNFGCCLAT